MTRSPGRRGAAGAARARGREAPARSALRIAAALLVLTSLAAGFAAARTVASLDRTVRTRFEGRLFRVPTRVLSAPLIVYPGLDARRIGLRDTLERLGYRKQERPGSLPPGRFRWDGGRVHLHRRAFAHPTRAEPAREVVIQLERSTIASLRDAESGRELGALLLEPELVGSYHGDRREQRELVRLGEVPDHLVDAVLAVEDQRFASHPGIDFRRVLGAFWANLRAGEIRQGGSTLTQQLVKNFFLTPERSFSRKSQEAVMALLVEARYDKGAILEAYLNEIYLGQRGSTQVHGVGEASRLYFGKEVSRLSLAESALLAAIIQSPNALSPHREPEAARERRDLVLHLMHEQGRIGEPALEVATREPLRVADVMPEPREARFFLDALRRQLPEYYDAETLTSEGLRVYSTLDRRLQRAAAKSLREGLARLQEHHPRLREAEGARLEGCLVALRPQTGEVLALVGGREYGESQFNRCTQARRPAGSVFKPFVYAAALEGSGDEPAATLATRIEDGPLRVGTPTGAWRPANYDHEFHGEVSVREAMERSLNVASARLGQRVGLKRVIDMARRLGVQSELPRVPSLAIGTADVSPLEIARAYATLANGGVRPEIRTFEDVVDPEGRAVDRQPIGFERVLDPGTSFLVTSLLRGVVERGTARGVRAAGIRGPVAGKTGTSDDERDAWFAGYTPELVAVVWVGFDDPRSLGLPASRAALPIWTRFLREATGGKARGAFVPPRAVERVAIDPESGARALDGCPRSEEEWFLRGTAPTSVCPEEGRRGSPGWAHRDDEPGEQGPGVIERVFRSWLDRL